MKLSCLDMRNNLAIVYDMLTKNIEKVNKQFQQTCQEKNDPLFHSIKNIDHQATNVA